MRAPAEHGAPRFVTSGSVEYSQVSQRTGAGNLADPRCGETRGYQAHRKRNEPPCDACREAQRVYVAAFRAAKPGAQQRIARKQHARDRALRELARLFPAEFERLYEREVAELDVAS